MDSNGIDIDIDGDYKNMENDDNHDNDRSNGKKEIDDESDID